MTDFMIVDDDEIFAAVLSKRLAKLGFSVSHAADEDTALRLCEQQQPENIILDLKLEKTSGLSLISQLKEIAAADCQIVMLTGYSSIPTTVEAIKMGAANYLCKPASVEDILRAFDRPEPNPEIDLPEQPPSVDRVEWEHIQKVLSDNSGNVSATARALGMHRRTLQRKLQKRPVKN